MSDEISSFLPTYADYSQVKCVHGFKTIKQDYAAYLSDESKLSASPFDQLFFPKDEAELAAVIHEMDSANNPITVAGARTGLVGGCVPLRGSLVSMELFNKVQGVRFDTDSREWRVRAQSAVNLKALDLMLRNKRFPDLEQASVTESVRVEYERFQKELCSYFYPPDPTEMSASLGGSVATNASGARTYRYGPTRSWIRSIRVLLADGELLDIPRGRYFASPHGQFMIRNSERKQRLLTIPTYTLPKTKNVSGFYCAPKMDLIDLFIGSEGVLGVITEIEVAILPREPKISVVQFLPDDMEAIKFAIRLRTENRLRLDFVEFYSGKSLELLREQQNSEPSIVGMPEIPPRAGAAIFFEMSFDSNLDFQSLEMLEEVTLASGADPQLSWTASEPRELDRFKHFRHLLPEKVNSIIAERKRQNPAIHKLGTDMAVPDEYLEEMWQTYEAECDRLQLEWCAFGHVGNNHIHVNILPKDDQDLADALLLYELLAKKAVALGGTISAEHGIGKIKSKFLPILYSQESIQQMRDVKSVLDPHWILNPDNIFSKAAAL